MSEVWVEKYRPVNLKDVSSQDEVISSLKNVIKNKNMPHLLFFGPSGCGKTSTILALANEIFGKDYMDRIIELNASDERGIKIIREKIKNYAKKSINLKDNIPPWKIIILDEADIMTYDSQYALRRIMEEYSKITRFCIICNYCNKIIDPIISRCSLFRFKPIPDNIMINNLKLICTKEQLSYSDNDINKISKICRGDFRKSINFLQRCFSLKSEVNENIIDEISGLIPKNELKLLLEYSKNYNKDIDKLIENLCNEGYSLVNQLYEIINLIIEDKEISSINKSKIIYNILDIDQNLLKGCNEHILFLKLFYYIISLLN